MQNYIQPGANLPVVVSAPATPTSGQAVRFGAITGVAVLAEGDGGVTATQTMVKFDGGVYDLSVTASSAIAAGDKLYLSAAATPVLGNASSDYPFGVALEAIASGTATINVLHIPSIGANQLGSGPAADATVEAHATTATLTNTSAGKILTNTGASGGIILTLPAASTMAGLWLRFAVTVAQTIQMLPATGEKIYLNGSGVASKYASVAGVIGNYVNVYCNGTDYQITDYSGVVTKES